MVRLARDVNRDAISQNRLEIREGEAHSLPYPDGIFTCAVMTGVFNFIQDPLKALSEIRRVLAGGGRFVLFTGSKELRGTPAAPEPMASRLHFYEDRNWKSWRERQDSMMQKWSGLTLSSSRARWEYRKNSSNFSREALAASYCSHVRKKNEPLRLNLKLALDLLRFLGD